MKLPTTAKAKWIGLIPSLDFKIVGYETKRSFFVEVSRTNFEGITVSRVFRNTGNGAFLYHGMNRCVKEAFEVAGFNLAYAEEFDRTAPHEFVRKMLNATSFQEGSFERNCYLFETL
jgi:hypothetical protein